MKERGQSLVPPEEHADFRFTVYLLFCVVLLFGVLNMTGCRKKDQTAVLTFNVENEEFSEAEISIDGISLGRMEQTIIKTNGELYINGELTATLPPQSPQIGKEDTYSGVLDSVTTKSGRHAIVISITGGKRLDISADISPGYHLITFFPSDGTLKWDNQTVKAIPGTTVTIPAK
ncbi:MAG TPA: hypothetical protein VHO84_06615 [Syntrophorhabdaceae bacterium]|nr:hypothetical protein [Syntrophorhabdaceae bacterium]